MIGYALMAIVIILATIILVYGAYGYSLNTKTGDVVQNGLLFLDSKPGGAKISLNDKDINATTGSRLILPAGNYSVILKRDGYRPWTRSIPLEEHNIARFVYPLLFPEKMVQKSLKSYESTPSLVTQSPDSHWILVQSSNQASGSVTFDQYDTGDIAAPIKQLIIPTGVMTPSSASDNILTMVEWSTDNNHVILKHSFGGSSEFIIFNRSEPSSSININSLFNINPTEVALRDKKISQLYLFDSAGGSIRIGDTDSGQLAEPFLRGVLSFKPYASNLILYATNKSSTLGKTNINIWNGGKIYKLTELTSGSVLTLDTAEFQGHFYYLTASDSDDHTYIYKDPLSTLANPAIGKAVPLLVFRISGVNKGGFSTNSRFLDVEADQKFGVYDMETKTRYQYSIAKPLAAPLRWMDGHRLIGESDSKVFVMDYDSSNQQILVPTLLPEGAYFSRNFNQLFTDLPSSDQSGVSFEVADMRAGADLPKTAQ